LRSTRPDSDPSLKTDSDPSLTNELENLRKLHSETIAKLQAEFAELETKRKSEREAFGNRIANLETESQEKERKIAALSRRISELVQSDPRESSGQEMSSLKRSIVDLEEHIQSLEVSHAETLARNRVRFQEELDERDRIIQCLRAKLREVELIRPSGTQSALGMDRTHSQEFVRAGDDDSGEFGALGVVEKKIRCDSGRSSSVWVLPPLIDEEQRRFNRDKVPSSRRTKIISVDG
jgi:hypothetical protein